MASTDRCHHSLFAILLNFIIKIVNAKQSISVILPIKCEYKFWGGSSANCGGVGMKVVLREIRNRFATYERNPNRQIVGKLLFIILVCIHLWKFQFYCSSTLIFPSDEIWFFRFCIFLPKKQNRTHIQTIFPWFIAIFSDFLFFELYGIFCFDRHKAIYIKFIFEWHYLS